MTKTKIAFAGFMGAILVSVGAANAATTSVATKGYVDQEIGNLGETYATLDAVAAVESAIDQIDLSEYQKKNLVAAFEDINSLTSEQKAEKYPSVQAVLDAIKATVDLDPSDVAALKDLIDEGVATKISGLETAVDTLNGDGEGSVAKSIADALVANQADWGQTDDKAADFIKNKPTDLVTAESLGTTLADYAKTADLTGTDGVITTIETTVTELKEVIGDDTEGLKADVAANTSAITENAAAIAENTQGISALERVVNDEETGLATKLPAPTADCVSESGACVLMTTKDGVSWVQVTKPLEDKTNE